MTEDIHLIMIKMIKENQVMMREMLDLNDGLIKLVKKMIIWIEDADDKIKYLEKDYKSYKMLFMQNMKALGSEMEKREKQIDRLERIIKSEVL